MRIARAAWIGVLALALAGGAPAPAAADDEVTIRAELDRETFHENEPFTLTITVEGPARGIGQPQLPDMEDFVVQGTSSSSSFQFINGRASSSKSFLYTMVPLRAGRLEIPGIVVGVKGEAYRTRPFRLDVRPSRATAGGQLPDPAGPGARPNAPPRGAPAGTVDEADSGDRNAFIRSWIDDERAYVGEQVTLHFALYRDPRVQFLSTPQYTPPDLTGFWSEPLGDEISGYRMVEGRNYAATELRTALFPSEAGELGIGVAQVRLTFRDRDDWGFFSFGRGRQRVLTTPPMALEVLPLPDAGRPADFQGTVATDLRLRAELEPGPYRVGQPATLTITLTGAGNPRAFGEPVLAVDEADFKHYEGDLQSRVSADADRIRVRKTFTRVLVPRREGTLTLPGVRYAWFDPEAGRYRTHATREIVMEVAPAAAEASQPVVFTDLRPDRVELLGRDIHHLKTAPLLAGDGGRLARAAGFQAALWLPWPLLLAAWLWRRRRERLAADVAGTRARGARRAASRRLKAAEAARRAGDFDAFCAELARALRGYLADRLDTAAAGLTADEIERRLTAAGAPEARRRETAGLLVDCDFARYAPGSEESTRMDALLERAAALLDALEGDLGRRRKRGGALTAVLPLALAAALALPAAARAQASPAAAGGSGSPSAAAGAPVAPAAAADARAQMVEAPASADRAGRMERAAALYEEGDVEGAARIWETLAAVGESDSHLWYNLGNAYYQLGDVGRAVLDYRRALRLSPRDREIRDNLELARSRAAGEVAAPEPGWWGRRWRQVRETLTGDELAAASLALLWIGTLLVLLGLFRRASWRRLRWPLIAVAALLPLLAAAAWRADWEDWSGREAVILAPRVAVQSGPGEGYVTLFEVHAGAEIKLVERRGAWALARLGADLEGWIPLASAERL